MGSSDLSNKKAHPLGNGLGVNAFTLSSDGNDDRSNSESIPGHSREILITSECSEDPWTINDTGEPEKNWSDYTLKEKILRVFTTSVKIILLIWLLYLFICSLDFLSSSFRLLGGKTTGDIFKNSDMMHNPLAGLMIGILATVLVQSSSTSTSVVVTMVASEIIDVVDAIPIVMGANVGTSVTNTIVSLAQCGDRNEFRRAFAAATVHDMFNWLTVTVFLTLEVSTGYLYHLTTLIVDSMNLETKKSADLEMLTVLTKPFTKVFIELDKTVMEGLALGNESYRNMSILKRWCKTKVSNINVTNGLNQYDEPTTTIHPCKAVFNQLDYDDIVIGAILLAISLIVLCSCLIFMVKILNSMLSGHVAMIIKRSINTDFPGRFAFLTGYVYILVGCGMTIIVQSSSIFTSTLTPLVGVGIISLDRMYPLTLGSNIGTTTTGILASLTATGSQLRYSVQVALCHLFFNISGILLFYPFPFLRFPITLAKILGNTTANYRWFAILYLFLAFVLLPGAVFALSAAGSIASLAVGIPFLALMVFVIVLNILQQKLPSKLPPLLRNWNFLPKWMHSLEPFDRAITFCHHYLTSTKLCKLRNRHNFITPGRQVLRQDSNTRNLMDESTYVNVQVLERNDVSLVELKNLEE
ncbi:hypothetical protein CHUAL_010331 [Chamberlinius hualienensis]